MVYKWQHKFDLLCAFQRENGHCQVPQRYIVDSVKLGQWVATQRQVYRNYMDGKKVDAFISEERIAQLNSIGFVWGAKDPMTDDEKWQFKFDLLCGFQRENGHCRVPERFHVDSVKLGIWVKNQRKAYRGNGKQGVACISGERIAQLNSIGFEWRVNDTTADNKK